MSNQHTTASEKGRITDVFLFITNIGSAKRFAESGVKVNHIAPRQLIHRADADLGFNGALIAYVDANWPLRPPIEVPEMTDQMWEAYLGTSMPPGHLWYRWYGESPTAVYTVAVVTHPLT